MLEMKPKHCAIDCQEHIESLYCSLLCMVWLIQKEIYKDNVDFFYLLLSVET